MLTSHTLAMTLLTHLPSTADLYGNRWPVICSPYWESVRAIGGIRLPIFLSSWHDIFSALFGFVFLVSGRDLHRVTHGTAQHPVIRVGTNKMLTK